MEGRKIRNDFEILWARFEVMGSFSSLQSVSKVVINTEFKIMLNFIPGLLYNSAPPHMCQMGIHMHSYTHTYTSLFVFFFSRSDVLESGFEFYPNHQRAPLPCLPSIPHNPACCTGLFSLTSSLGVPVSRSGWQRDAAWLIDQGS